MKKVLIFVIIIMMFIPLITGCSDDSVVEIDERVFLTMVTHINQNSNDYIGRTVRFEGMFQSFYLPALGGDYHEVYRKTLGCCGDDGFTGFIVYLGDIAPLQDNAWVEVVGAFEWLLVELPQADDGIEREPIRLLRVAADSITELDERGLEFVVQ